MPRGGFDGTDEVHLRNGRYSPVEFHREADQHVRVNLAPDSTAAARGARVRWSMRFAFSLPMFLLLHWAGLVPPGASVTANNLTCPTCRTPATFLFDHSGICPHCRRRFQWTTCPSKSDHDAYSFGYARWRCHKGHGYKQAVLCPHCWALGTSSSAHEWTCFGKHVFYQRGLCDSCGFGFLVCLHGGREWVCTSCRKTKPVTR